MHKLDEENIKTINSKYSNVNVFVYSKSEELNEIYEDIIANLHFPNDICLSYSTIGDNSTDILSHGKYLSLRKILKIPYVKYHKKVKFSSAENIIYEIISKKTDKELNRLKLISNITDRILKETFNTLKIGMNEIEIVELTKNITKEIMKKYINLNDIIDFDFAWENCPIVLTGENLAKGGHSLPSKKLLKPGDTIYFDFGIKVKFKDNMCLYAKNGVRT